MPKILNDLEERILIETERLFLQEETSLDMRNIAERCGVAVGTVYNYFPGKGDLLYRIFKRQWDRTLAKLQAITTGDNGWAEKLDRFVGILYSDIESRHAIFAANTELKKDFHQEALGNIEKYHQARKWLAGELGIVLAPLSEDKEYLTRIAITALETCRSLLLIYPEEKEKNIEYIKDLLQLELER